MPSIPRTEHAAVIRTDFSDDAAWKAVCEAIVKPASGFRAYVDFISDPAFSGLDVEKLLASVPEKYRHSFLFVVDGMALTHPEHPILVVDLYGERGRAFRVIPSEMWGIENNLSIANMDFFEFADAVDRDGIFRGFPMN
jgi:hypothetical protein